MSTTVATLQSVISKIPRSRFVWFDKWHSTSKAKLEKVARTQVCVDTDGVMSATGGFVKPLLPRVLSFADAKKMAKTIDDLSVGGNHLTVKTNAEWCRIYQKANYQLPKMDSSGTVTQTATEAIPCHNCGWVVPMAMVQVDHHMPQADGKWLYTLKMARALGLTNNGPTGGKGMAIIAGTLSTLTLNPKGRDSSYNHLLNPTPKAKFELNEKGSAFFSLLASVQGGLDIVQSKCKNNILNLVPLCGECNRNKSDFVKPRV